MLGNSCFFICGLFQSIQYSHELFCFLTCRFLVEFLRHFSGTEAGILVFTSLSTGEDKLVNKLSFEDTFFTRKKIKTWSQSPSHHMMLTTSSLPMHTPLRFCFRSLTRVRRSRSKASTLPIRKRKVYQGRVCLKQLPATTWTREACNLGNSNVDTFICKVSAGLSTRHPQFRSVRIKDRFVYTWPLRLGNLLKTLLTRC